VNVFAFNSFFSWSTVFLPGPAKDQLLPPPRTSITIKKVMNLVIGFARARKEKERQKTIVDLNYPTNSYSENQINCILCYVK